MYPKLIVTYADDVYEFNSLNEDGSANYRTIVGCNLVVNFKEIGTKYRILEQ